MAIFGNEGSIALVTGAASGIGAATAQQLVSSGVRGVVLLDRDAKGLARVAESLPSAVVLQRVQDVADEAAWIETCKLIKERFGRLDFAVANAGISDAGPISEYPLERWRRIMSVNLDGVFLTLKTAMPLIKSGGRGGAIVVVSSASGVKAEQGIAGYGASKAGAIQLAKVAAKEGAADRIRVNAILPGGVETPLWHQMPFFQNLAQKLGSESAAFNAIASAATPLGRYARADEVAAQILHLLSDASSLVTGTSIVMDGGYTL